MLAQRTLQEPWAGGGAEPDADTINQGRARRGNRRRFIVFGVTFVIALALGQAWNFTRPSEYQASSRLQITLPDAGRAGSGAAANAFATKLQLINSRPVLTELGQALGAQGVGGSWQGEDPVGRLQSMLQVLPVQGSEVVELKATGTEPQLLATLLNAMPDIVLRELQSRQRGDADAQIATARQELTRLERLAVERRARLEAFRQRAGVMVERDDNEAVARSKGLNQALNVAVEKEAAAAARVKAVQQALEEGRASTGVRADATLANIEARASKLREELRELEKTYTPAFMAMDPRARQMQTRLAELEAQAVQQRDISQRAALQSAKEDHFSAQAQVEKLRTQLAAIRPALTRTVSQMGSAKVLEDDLAQVEKARREVLERVARLEADEQRRVAVVKVIESAVAPTVPFRPDHGHDALIVLGVAFALALVVMGTVEAFNRTPAVAPVAPSPTVLVSPGWDPKASLALDAGRASARLQGRPSVLPAIDAPAVVEVLPQADAAALVTAAQGTARFVCACALLGLTVKEAMAVRRDDFSEPDGTLRVRGRWSREITVPPWLAEVAPEAPMTRGAVAHGDDLPSLSSEYDVSSLVMSAALDAGIANATAVGWDTLRLTCVDWLVGQGVRYGELPNLVGSVDAETLRLLSARHEGVERRPMWAIEFPMPALKLESVT